MVKKLSRDSIQRMVRGGGSTGYSTGGAGGGVVGISMGDVWSAMAGGTDEQINGTHLTDALTGYATQNWVGQNYLPLTGGTISGNLNVTGTLKMASKPVATQEWVGNNYLSIAFFNRLFKAYNGSTQVNPNDTTTAIDNIKAMFGFWTEFYITALGTGGQSTLGIRLSQLADVNVSGVTNGKVLMYDSTTNKWVPGNVSGGGGTGVVAWADITGKPATYPPSAHNHDDRYYINNGTIYLGTGSITPITSLSGYATTSWVSNNFLGNNALSGYCQSSWVEDNFFSQGGGTIHGNVQIKLDNSNYGGYIIFGDRPNSGQDYAYIGENSDDHMVLYGKRGVLVQAGGTGGTSGRLILESLVSGDVSGMDIACNGDSILNLQSTGTNYGRIELSTAHGVSMYSTNENTVISLQDWSSQGYTPGINILTKGGDITINPSTGSTEVYNFVNMSDIRKKNLISNMEYDLKIFAKAPLFSFTWKEGNDRRIHIGTSAQYWMEYIPETVSRIEEHDPDGKIVIGEHLSLDYITVAYAGVTTLSRVVENHEERISHIEEILEIA